MDTINLFANMTKEHFYKAIQKTYVQTLNQMPHIRANVGVIRELERYLNRLERADKSQENVLQTIGMKEL